MGVIKQGILGGFTGKVGSVVGTSWKGRAVMKAMPLSVANPRTASQVAQRTAFGDCVGFAKHLVGGAILLLDNPFSGNISGYNRFVKRNVHAFPITETVSYESISISNGPLGAVTLGTVPAMAAGDDTVTIPISSRDSAYNMDNDVLVAVVFSITRGAFINTGEPAGTRVVGNAFINFSEEVEAGEKLVFFLAALRQDGKYVSSSDVKLATVAV